MRKRIWIVVIVCLVLLTSICIGAVYLFPRLAGQSVSQLVIPVPPDNRLLGEIYSIVGGYHYRTGVYALPGTLIDARQWFGKNRIALTPVDNSLSKDDTEYHSIQIFSDKNEYTFLIMAANVTGMTLTGILPSDCFSVSIYKSIDVAVKSSSFPTSIPKPGLNLPQDSIVALIRTCWPSA
jgi:hypothetical protein